MSKILRGWVNQDLEPTVEIQILFEDTAQTFRFVIDTGFTGAMMIPSEIAARFPIDGQEVFVGIEDTEFTADLHRLKMRWLSEETSVSAIASEQGYALIGMEMLLGTRPEIDLLNRTVLIEKG